MCICLCVNFTETPANLICTIHVNSVFHFTWENASQMGKNTFTLFVSTSPGFIAEPVLFCKTVCNCHHVLAVIHHRKEHIETFTIMASLKPSHIIKSSQMQQKTSTSNCLSVTCAHTGSSVILLLAYQRQSLLHKEPGAIVGHGDRHK